VLWFFSLAMESIIKDRARSTNVGSPPFISSFHVCPRLKSDRIPVSFECGCGSFCSGAIGASSSSAHTFDSSFACTTAYPDPIPDKSHGPDKNARAWVARAPPLRQIEQQHRSPALQASCALRLGGCVRRFKLAAIWKKRERILQRSLM
jgi:hypothetical protein